MSMAHVFYVNPDSPQLAKYPLFSRATPIEFTINAGELLFLPAFWWHQVQCEDTGISVSFWWAPEFQYCIDCPNGLRMLYNLYCVDRLKEFGATVLKPSSLNFLQAAQLLLGLSQHGLLPYSR
jgi:jumonji domain-containing protein 7